MKDSNHVSRNIGKELKAVLKSKYKPTENKTGGKQSSKAKASNTITTDERMAILKKLAAKICEMTPEQRVELTRAKSLKDMDKGSLLEIHFVETKTGEFGTYGVAMYLTTLTNGSRAGGSVRLACNAMQQADLVAPCILLYTGTKLGRNGKAFYDVHVIAAPSQDAEEHRKFADGLRALSTPALLNYMTLTSLEKFEVGANILFKDVHKKKLCKDSGEDSLTVSFETDKMKDKGKASGTLIVPLRMEAKLKRYSSGIMVYEGLKTSQIGRQYHHVNVVDESLLDVL